MREGYMPKEKEPYSIMDIKTTAIPHILVVEDEVIVAKNIQNRLEKLGYSVPAVVSSGEEAVKKAAETHPDIILMDIKLEGDMDGIEVAEQIRHSFNIPIVYLTACADDKTLQRAKITEPYGYIIKPFEERELQSNIEIALYKHKMENKLKKNRERLQNIINSTSEIIISLDKNNRVSTWNKAAELITGYKQKEVIRRHITKLDVFDKSQELLDNIKSICNGKRIGFDKLILKEKNGAKRIIRFSCPPDKSVKEQYNGVLFVGRDITRDIETHGKLLGGNSYLVPDKDNKSALYLFIDLTMSGYKGLFITRAALGDIGSMIPSKDIQVVLLKQNRLGGFENIQDLDGLTARIKKFSMDNTDSVILLDRVDYLLTNFSFEQFVKSLYQIDDIISENKSILLVHLDPLLLDTKQMAIIEKELHFIPSQKIEDVEIGDELYDILKLIYKQNQNNALVSFKKISREFSAVSKTTAKRLGTLENKGLIFIKKQGRLKTLHISGKGKTLLNKRQVV